MQTDWAIRDSDPTRAPYILRSVVVQPFLTPTPAADVIKLSLRRASERTVPIVTEADPLLERIPPSS